jgi:hypothetical protein
VSDLLAEQHEVDFAEAHAFVRLGHEQPDQADLGELLPERARPARLARPQRAHGVGCAFAREEVAHGLLEQLLVFREVELHRVISASRESARR